jgi:hypothetical protein
LIMSLIVHPAHPRSHRGDPPAFCRRHRKLQGVATV